MYDTIYCESHGYQLRTRVCFILHVVPRTYVPRAPSAEFFLRTTTNEYSNIHIKLLLYQAPTNSKQQYCYYYSSSTVVWDIVSKRFRCIPGISSLMFRTAAVPLVYHTRYIRIVPGAVSSPIPWFSLFSV